MTIKLIHDDCLIAMNDIPDGGVDFILTDPPYGTTACKWDSVIPFEPMWDQIWRILKPNGVCALFGSEPFSSFLICSNIKNFKHNWVWKKSNPKGHLNAKKYPLKVIETISIFCRKKPNYYPQFWESKPMNVNYSRGGNGKDSTYGKMNKVIPKEQGKTKRYPIDILEFNDVNNNSKRLHPTQKPIALLEYLIKTYTLEGETVLDFTMGSGSTGVAAKNLNRHFIGIEKDKGYYNIANNRIKGL